ncbi:MAG: TRAP transporter large permease subunit [Pseudomonadota bacterium]|nr:TRAP transporter large permease subunit [Pseudomonadota bacterium]MEE2997489.1 TRAP transporter large permease subunit [Pseudomonadota bacterium]
MTVVVRAFDKLVAAFNAAGSGWIFIMMLLLTTDVVCRAAFNAPIKGIPLLIEMSMLVIVFMQLPSAIRADRLTRSDVLLARLLRKNPSVGLPLKAVYDCLGVFLMIIVFWYTLPVFFKVWERNTYDGLEGDFALPTWPFKLLVLVGAIFCAIQFWRAFLDGVRLIARLKSENEFKFQRIFFISITFGAACIAIWLLATYSEISSAGIGVISIFFVLFFVYVGVHVGVALALISFVCVWAIRDIDIGGRLLALSAGESMQQYEFGVIPLFVLMGLLVSISGIGRDTYDVANNLFRKLRGGLGTATVGANAVFAAVTGTSIASASVFTRVAVPEMLRLGYKPRFSVGVVAGSSVLGMLIPPSLLLIIFGIIAEQSIGDLFMAGIVPGIVLAGAYCILIWIMARRFPDKVGSPEALKTDRPRLMPPLEAAQKSLPIVLLIILVLGGIYGGLFTATEAGGVGAFGALILTFLKGKLSRAALWEALRDTGHVTASICFLLLSAHIYSRMIALTGIPGLMEDWVMASGLGVAGLITIYVIAIILMGTILDAGSIMLITVPLAIPALAPFEIDLIWFGIVTIIAVEIGLLTPPLGLACFVIHNNLQDDRIGIEDVFWGAVPFAITMLIVLLLVIALPELATALL